LPWFLPDSKSAIEKRQGRLYNAECPLKVAKSSLPVFIQTDCREWPDPILSFQPLTAERGSDTAGASSCVLKNVALQLSVKIRVYLWQNAFAFVYVFTAPIATHGIV
jgi:hypothetical protein